MNVSHEKLTMFLEMALLAFEPLKEFGVYSTNRTLPTLVGCCGL